MLRHIFSLLILICGLALRPACGQIAERQISLLDADGKRAMPVRLWQTTAATKAPLIILVHGTGGDNTGLAWVAAELAQRGALVLAASHPGSTGGSSPADILQVWRQPQDVRAMLDQILASGLGQQIERDKIAVLGFSLGGYTAMALAGARLQFERFPAFCALHDDGACRYFSSAFAQLPPDHAKQANADQFEPRLAAAIAIAPGLTESMLPESVRGLKTPLLLLTAENDGQVPLATHTRPLLAHLPAHSRYLEIPGACHFSFLRLMPPPLCARLAQEGEGYVCCETAAKSRAQIHAEALKGIVEFLQQQRILPK